MAAALERAELDPATRRCGISKAPCLTQCCFPLGMFGYRVTL